MEITLRAFSTGFQVQISLSSHFFCAQIHTISTGYLLLASLIRLNDPFLGSIKAKTDDAIDATIP